ncbi:MAG: uroporphyrinogen-III synthase [Gallionellaceae bacterium]|jgi:uroporphyrinogen-III synthase
MQCDAQDKPLAGLNIVVTRPRAQAGQLQQDIEQLGGKVILFPLLEIAPATDEHALQKVTGRLAEFNLAIFISPNAVRYGLKAIGALSNIPATLQIASVGQSSAQALREAGIKQVIVPQGKSDSEALLALPELQNVQGWKIAIFRGDGGRELLGDTLKARGARVEYVSCYQRSKARQDLTVLLAQPVDAITVSSSEALQHLWEMLGKQNTMQLADTAIFVPHARIAENARNMGWKQVFLTPEGDAGVVAGLVSWTKPKSIGMQV